MAQESPHGMMPFATAPLMHLAENGSQAMAAMNGSMMRTWIGCSQEIFELIGERAKAYMGLAGEFAGCSTAQDVSDLQGRFWQTMMHDYQSRASNIGGLMMEMWNLPVEAASETAAGEPAQAAARKPSAKPAAASAEQAA